VIRRSAAWIVRAAATCVPEDARHDFRAEWLAELYARPAGVALIAFACGAPWHALWLQKEQWRPEMVSADIRFGWRQVRRRPGVAIAAILTLAIGIGATTAIFSVVYGVLLKPLPYREPSRLVQLWETNPLFNWTEANVAPGNMISWLERNKTLESMAWYFGSDTRAGGTSTLSYGGTGEPVRVTAEQVSVNFFDVLGTRPFLGRAFLPGEDVAGKQRVTVLSYAFWRRQFGGDTSVINRMIPLNGRDYLVAGVLPQSFSFDNNTPDCWLPMVLDFAQVRESRRPHYLRVVARLRPGVTVEQARADIVSIASDLERQYPGTNTQMSAGLGPLADWFVGPTRRPLMAFLGAVALLLLIACVNVANLFLARTIDRSREMSLRAALGANRLRLIRQLISEAGVVAAAGAIAGIALAYGGLRLFLRLAPDGLPRLDEIGLNLPVAAFAVAVTGAVTLMIGLVPAWQASRTDLRAGLGDGGRTIAGPGRLRRVLVGAEVSLAVVLLVGAALTLRSFVALVSVRPSFAVSGLVSAQLSLPGIRYGDPGTSAQFFETLASRLRSEPGVIAAGAASVLPLEGNEWTGQLFIDGRPDVHGREVRHKTVTMGYLETLGVPLIAGRVFSAPDVLNGQTPIVVNQALVKKYFPDGHAVGSRIAQDTPNTKTTWYTILGVVADEPQDGLGIPAEPEIYDPELLQDASKMAVLIRSTMPPQDAVALLRRAVRDKDAQVALYNVRSMDEGLWRSVARERLAMSLAVMFAISALLLAAVGIYGVAAHGVAQRTREIGVRVAFGATRSNVVTMLLRDELTVVAAGLVAGSLAAFLMARAISAMLFQTTATDWVSYAAGAALLVASAVLACVVPARRALGVDPMVALRND
jgi:predicted permease